MNTTKKVAVMDPVRLAERAKNAEHRTSRAYLACLAGMWAEHLGIERDPITKADGDDIHDWYRIGVGASADAKRMTETVAAKEKAAEEKAKKKGLRGLFRLK